MWETLLGIAGLVGLAFGIFGVFLQWLQVRNGERNETLLLAIYRRLGRGRSARASPPTQSP